MTCLFCDSLYHPSQNCKRYASERSRKKILRQKSLCIFCLKSYSKGHRWRKCKKMQKCFNCFSDGHINFFCKVPSFFLPKIDSVLCQRFYHMFDPREQYSLAFSSADALNLFPITPLEIATTLPSNADYKRNTNIFVKETAFFCGIDSLPDTTKIIGAERVEIECCTFSSPTTFFQLIPSNIKSLFCYHLYFSTTPVTLIQIIEKIPNILEIEFCKTQIDVGGCSLDARTIYRRESNSLEVISNTNSLDFKDFAKMFAELNYFQITLKINIIMIRFDSKKYESNRQKLNKNLLKHFVRVHQIAENVPALQVSTSAKKPDEPGYVHFGYFQLK